MVLNKHLVYKFGIIDKNFMIFFLPLFMLLCKLTEIFHYFPLK